MLRGFRLLAVLACVAITVGYVVTEGKSPSDVDVRQDCSQGRPNERVISFDVSIELQLRAPNRELNTSSGKPEQLEEPEIEDRKMNEVAENEDPQFGILRQNARADRSKRSMAIGRTGWRPGKRSEEIAKPISKRSTSLRNLFWLPNDSGDDYMEEKINKDRGQEESVYEENSHEKRSLAIGRSQWRPGKRAILHPLEYYPEFGYDIPFGSFGDSN